MTLEEIKKKVFKYANNPDFEELFNYMFYTYHASMILFEHKYVPPDRAYSLRVDKDGTRQIIGWDDTVFLSVRKTKNNTLLLNEGTSSQIEMIGNKTYHFGKEIPIISELEEVEVTKE